MEKHNVPCQNTMDYLAGWDAADKKQPRTNPKSTAWLNGYEDFVMQDQSGNDSYEIDHAETEDDL
jgi:hypothetical protein